MENDLKARILRFLQSQREKGAVIDELLDQPDIGCDGRPAVTKAVDELTSEGKIAGRDLIDWQPKDGNAEGIK